MKGGRTAPRNLPDVHVRQLQQRSFNEGGADCPPKLSVLFDAPSIGAPLQ